MHIARIFNEAGALVAEHEPQADFYDAVIWAAQYVQAHPGTRYEIARA